MEHGDADEHHAVRFDCHGHAAVCGQLGIWRNGNRGGRSRDGIQRRFCDQRDGLNALYIHRYRYSGNSGNRDDYNQVWAHDCSGYCSISIRISFVMDTNAVIYNSALNDPTTWDALDIITAEKEPGAGVALAKSQSYVIALKEWSTEFSTITRTLQALRLNQCSAPLRWSAARPENRSQRLTKRSIG